MESVVSGITPVARERRAAGRARIGPLELLRDAFKFLRRRSLALKRQAPERLFQPINKVGFCATSDRSPDPNATNIFMVRQFVNT
jgi:hypothetical protein